MNRSSFVSFILAAVVLITAIVGVGCDTSNTNNSNATPRQSAQSSVQQPPGTEATTSSYDVKYEDTATPNTSATTTTSTKQHYKPQRSAQYWTANLRYIEPPVQVIKVKLPKRR